MLHESLIAIVVIGLVLAFVFGTIAHRLKISPLVGYLLAGVAVGPYTPGFVADQGLAAQLAEIGVVLLMFGVGLHFSLRDLLSVKWLVIPGAMTQIVVAALLGMGVAWMLGWARGSAFVFGLSLSVASTVVLLRALQDRRLMDTQRGHIAVGWLVVQDLLTVIGLVLLPPLAELLKGGGDAAAGEAALDTAALATTLAITLGKVAAFIAFMLVVGRRVVPALLHYIAHTGSRELFRLAVLAVALGVAFSAAELFGVSFALGAFFAGMILSESELSQRAAEETLPLRDAFAVLFFISVGMLFDPVVILHQFLPVIGTLLAIFVGGAGTAFLIVRAYGYPLGTALLVAAGLAQIGEFSFILADLGIGLGLLPPRARDLILGASILSIFANPIWFALLDRLAPWIARHEGAAAAPDVDGKAAEAELPVTTLKDHAVLIGYGRVGGLVGESLKQEGWPLLVIEQGEEAVERLRSQGIEAIAGNAAEDRVLKAANLAQARVLLVAIPEAFEAGQIVQQGRAANTALEIVARAHFDAEVEHLLQHGATKVIMGEREIARTMLDYAKALPRVSAAGGSG
jgi:CPA2 family monovalent cation:H+ antiporter-2